MLQKKWLPPQENRALLWKDLYTEQNVFALVQLDWLQMSCTIPTCAKEKKGR